MLTILYLIFLCIGLNEGALRFIPAKVSWTEADDICRLLHMGRLYTASSKKQWDSEGSLRRYPNVWLGNFVMYQTQVVSIRYRKTYVKWDLRAKRNPKGQCIHITSGGRAARSDCNAKRRLICDKAGENDTM